MDAVATPSPPLASPTLEWDEVKPMGVIRVGLHPAREVTTHRDIHRVAIGSEEVADIPLPQVRNPHQILVVAVAPGTSNLIIWYLDNTVDDEALANGYKIHVDAGYKAEMITGTQTNEDASLK